MSRKYKQRGYQDDEPRQERSRSGPRPERPEGPRGRGFGAPTATVFRCARCGALQTPVDRLAADATCSSCGTDLHTCTNCRHFDTGSPNECRVEIPARIGRKSSRNDCELYASKEAKELDSDASEPSDPRSEFDSLFNF